MATTSYRVRSVVEIVKQILDGTAALPDHMKLRQIDTPGPEGHTCVVTFEDTKAPHSLDGKLIEPIFTLHADGRVTVEYGDPVDES